MRKHFMTTAIRTTFSVFIAAAALAVVTVPALAYVVPNITAVTSTDQQMAVAYADDPSLPGAMDQAGAFTTTMQSYGFIGIPNYDAAMTNGSYLVCEMPQAPHGLWTVYGLQGNGVYEAEGFCSFMQNSGVNVRWRLNG
jgi:hypothetical protein